MTSNADTLDTTEPRPPYALALAVFAVVLTGYVISLAPTVTFWDAGEFIATTHILGIPHPPGTPLFVVLGHTWDTFIPWLATAFKMNLMSATFSAGAAAFLFLFVHETLRAGSQRLDGGAARLYRVGGAFAATLCSAFAFTVWQISNDTGKVYQVAMFLIAVSIWLAWLWRRGRGGPRGAHLLLLMIYILGLALANHLIGLLGGPALFAFMYHTLRTEPERDEKERRVQWAQLFVAVALWVSLVGLSMGKTGFPILVLGLVLYVIAAGWAFRVGTGLFGVVALLVAVMGLSTYAFLFIRAGLHPMINEADPSTLRNLWAVIGREQYPPRSPLDNPIYPSGPDNPGRTLSLFGLQVLNWIQYFDWQWASSLMRSFTLLAPARLPFTLLFIALGVLGAHEQRENDRSSFWLIATLFATTSIGLVVYLNFKPGFSLALQTYTDREMHEVRERDYFYTISYLMWGLWAGLGVASLFRRLRERLREGPVLSSSPVLLLALIPFVLNFKAAGRHYTPAAHLPRDFAYDMLIGVEPYGILFTNGDNDTFPLWYLQEVEGVRQDVVIVNLSLVNTDWYIRQLRDNPARPYRPDGNALRLFGPVTGAPPACSPAWADTLDRWAHAAGRRPPDRSRGMPACLHTLTDDQINMMEPRLLANAFPFRAGNIHHVYPAGTGMYVKDIMTLRLIQENVGRRPIYFALTAGGQARMGLEKYVAQEGLAFKLYPDTVRQTPNLVPGFFGVLVDMHRTQQLAWNVYRYAGLLQPDSLQLEPTDDNIAGNLSFVFLTLGDGYRQTGDMRSMLTNYERAYHLAPSPQLRDFLAQVRGAAALPGLTGGDTAKAQPAESAAQRGGGRKRDSSKSRR